MNFFRAHLLGAQTGIPVNKMLWLQPFKPKSDKLTKIWAAYIQKKIEPKEEFKVPLL